MQDGPANLVISPIVLICHEPATSPFSLLKNGDLGILFEELIQKIGGRTTTDASSNDSWK